MNNEHNNITNINEYRENMMPDATGVNINTALANTPNGMTDGVGYECFPQANVEEFVSQEFVNSYVQVTDSNTPDLWSRIEAGFEVEAKDVIAEQRLKSKRVNKVVGFVAAVFIVAIIALPVMALGIGGEKSDERMEATTVAENNLHYDEVSDSVAMEAPTSDAMEDVQEEMAVESVTEADASMDGKINSSIITDEESDLPQNQSTDGNETNSELQAQLKEIEGVQTDDRQLVIKGEFIFDHNSNEVTFSITEISNNQYDEFIINVGDKITLSNPMFVLTMDIMLLETEITLDSVKEDEVGNILGRIIQIDLQGLSIEKEYIDN